MFLLRGCGRGVLVRLRFQPWHGHSGWPFGLVSKREWPKSWSVMGGHPLWTMRRPPPRGASQVRLPIVSCSSTRSLHRLGATMPAASRRSCHLPEFGSAHANAGLFIKR